MNSFNLGYGRLTGQGKWWLTISLILFFTLRLGSAWANPVNEELEDQVRTISHMLRCPTCQAMSVKESEAGLSVNMKNKIREMLQQGKSESEILDFFVDRYGEWILRSPRKEGFNLVLWLTPLALILLVGLIVISVLWKRSRQEQEQSLTPLSAKEKALLDRDLDRFQTE